MPFSPENQGGLEFSPAPETEIQSVLRLWRTLNSSPVYANFRQVADSLVDIKLASLRAPKIISSDTDRLASDLRKIISQLETNDPLRTLEKGLIIGFTPFEKRSPLIVHELRYNKDERASGKLTYVGETLYITITEREGKEVIEIGHMQDTGETIWKNVAEASPSEWTSEESIQAMREIFKDNPVKLPYDTYIPPLLRETP